MSVRRPQLNFKTLLALIVAGVGLTGAALLAHGATRPVAKVIRPTTAVSNAATVAGAAIVSPGAPTPTPTLLAPQTVAPTKTSGPVSAHPVATTQTAASAQAPVPQQYVTLTIGFKTDPITTSVKFISGMDACSILEQAKIERKINTYTADDSYMKTLKSLMIIEINGYTGIGWMYSLKDAAGNIIHDAPGCSLNPLQPGYSVTWKPA